MSSILLIAVKYYNSINILKAKFIRRTKEYSKKIIYNIYNSI